MSPLLAIRASVSCAAYLGAGFCLWQAQNFWDGQEVALRSPANAWMDLLRQHVVVVDAGHGGTDGGTQGFGVLEKNCALEIARRLQAQLHNRGIRTVMTRGSDEYVELAERSAIANRHAASVFVSVHLNADATSDETAGVETYFCSRKSLGDLVKLRDRLGIARERSFKDGRSEYLARTVQRAICGATGATDRRARDSNYLVVMQAECPAVLVECGYLTSETESKRLVEPEYQDKIAVAVAESVKNFLLGGEFNAKRGIVFDTVANAIATGTPREGVP